MNKQIGLIGEHPDKSDAFGKWLDSVDLPHTDKKCHRKLSEQLKYDREEIIARLSDYIIKYHYPDERLRRLARNYEKLGFSDYADYLERSLKTPKNLNTQKGNLTEIILCQYVCAAKRKKLKHIYRFRYNPNVDQSMKGDDMLMIDDSETLRVYLGEAKFRKKPTKKAIEDVSRSLTKEKQPLSYTFLIDILEKDPETRELSERLDEFVRKTIKSSGDITYVGLILGGRGTAKTVEDHLNNDNPNLVIISLEIENPENLIIESFQSAQEKLLTPNFK